MQMRDVQMRDLQRTSWRACAGSVGPIICRHFSTAPSACSSIAKDGPLPMYSISFGKKERSACSAYSCRAVSLRPDKPAAVSSILASTVGAENWTGKSGEWGWGWRTGAWRARASSGG